MKWCIWDALAFIAVGLAAASIMYLACGLLWVAAP